MRTKSLIFITALLFMFFACTNNTKKTENIEEEEQEFVEIEEEEIPYEEVIGTEVSTETINGIIILSENNFSGTINSGLFLVDFYADWCKPCVAMTPVLEEFAKLHGNTLKVAKINIDNATDLSGKYNIVSIPCLVLFKDGKEIKRLIGSRDISNLSTELQEYL
ncbi:MAG: thioredoxin family protein [Bacteroidales bacterium]|jgi:thioredoxin 1|nr:thioredoxin family protein [Bacteroidales bacterium]